MPTLALLTTALLFGGMALFAFGFAAFIFDTLPAGQTGPVIRRAFAWFYLFVLGASAVAAGLALAGDAVSAGILAAIALTALYARQSLMPAVNRATDSGDKARFRKLHGFSVAITLAHIAGSGWVLTRLAA
ncbi:MAG: DUF4149 domain-containing protein [Salinarimonadaceae bacterium]|nr:MAG: DUF4149 domain-containing protein [Salinarimonadaceae bacterium]